jgi:hypothetical protein
MNASDIELALRARAAFNDSVACIDADTRRRLRELRQRAQHDAPHCTNTRWAWPVGAALAAALALVTFMPHMPHAPVSAMPAATVTVAQSAATRVTVNQGNSGAVAEVAATDALEAADPEMLSDLDFYGWLAKQPGTRASGG